MTTFIKATVIRDGKERRMTFNADEISTYMAVGDRGGRTKITWRDRNRAHTYLRCRPAVLDHALMAACVFVTLDDHTHDSPTGDPDGPTTDS